MRISTDLYRPNKVILAKALGLICKDLVCENKIMVGEEMKGENLWEIDQFLKKYNLSKANKKVLVHIFEIIKVYEQNFPTVGMFLINYFANGSIEYKVSEKIRPSANFALSKTFKTLNNSESAIDIFKTIRDYGNASVSVSIEREPIEKPIIRLAKNSSVKLRIAPGFVARGNYFKNCKWLMIDGAVSTSSEIMRLLNDSFANKEATYFIVCKSFNEQILYTLQENYNRGLTNVIPIEFGFDLESINSLADLVSLIGGSPLSPLLGDAIASYKDDRMGSSSYVKNDQEFCYFPNSGNKHHINNLIKKIDDTNDETKKLLSRRLARLKGNSCNILLPNNIMYNKLETEIKHITLVFNSFCKSYMYIYKINNKSFYLSGRAHGALEKVLLQIENLSNLKLCILKN